MKQTVHLYIPAPCSEDWDNMQPVDQGRHCAHCCKTVVDFTEMSDREVFRFFKETAKPRAAGGSGGVCGRFMADQLGRELAPAPVQRNGWSGWKWMIAGSLVLSKGSGGARPAPPLVGIPVTSASSVDTAIALVPRAGYEVPALIPDGSISVRNLPDSDVIVGFVSPPLFGVEDSGAVVNSGTLKETRITGEPVVMGDTTIPVTMGELARRIDLDTTEKIDTTELPECVVTGKVATRPKNLAFTGGVVVIPAMDLGHIPPDTPSLLTKLVDTVVNIVRDTTVSVRSRLWDEGVMAVYPNPVVKGGQVRLAWKGQPGRLMVTLVSAHGEMIGEREFEVAGKGQVDGWVVPQGLAAGSYFLWVLQAGKVVQTTELLVL